MVIDFFLNGQKQMSGMYSSKNFKKKNGEFIYFYENGQKDSEGIYIKDLRDGEWKWYFDNGQMSSKELYEKGEIVEFEFWNEDGSIVEGDFDGIVLPEFIGGMDAYMSYLIENVKYPEKAIRDDIYGMVKINIIIGKDGTIEETRVLKSIHPLLDEEALRVVMEMTKWKPGKVHNRLERISLTLPINFKLE